MRTWKFLIFSSLFTILVFSACKRDDLLPGDALVYVPGTVTSVTAINVNRLMEKADFDALKQMEFYQDFLEKVRQENSAFAQVMRDPRKAGIDLDNNVYLNVELDQPGQSGMMTVVFTIKDKNAFEKTLDDLDINYLPASQEPGLFQEHGTALLWNEAVGILGFGSENTIQQQVEAYLNTSEEQSVNRNKNLRDALSNDFDVLNWTTSAGFVDLFQIGPIGKVARYTEEDLRENYLQSYLFFEEGQVRAETRYQLQSKLATDLALVLNDEVDTDFSESIPHDNLFFFANFGLRPKGINQLLIEYHIQGLSDESFKQYGFTMEDVINAFSGDAAIAIYQEDNDQIINFPSFLMVYDIDSREHLDRILLAAQNTGHLDRIGENRYQVLSGPNPDTLGSGTDRVEAELLIKDNLLYFSDNSLNHIEQIAGGNFNTNGKLPKTMQSLTAKNAFAALVDIAWLSQVEDDLEDMPVQSIASTASRKKAAVTVKMEAETTNSLKQLFRWMNQKYLEKKVDKPAEEEDKS